MISPTYIFDYFSTAWGPATSDPTYYSEAEDGRVEVLDRIFSVKEVSTKLKKADNTSPGPDRITYHHWRQIDPSTKTLTTIFNLCLEFKKIPEDWKSATTILIPKDGDAADPRNWRPIALSNTLYKLFTKCLAARLSDWCSRYDVLSHCQKGFLPHDGVLEHNYALKNAELTAREKKKEICIAWVDVSNAFGALPHSAIFDALHNAKVGQGFVELVRDIYCGSTTQVLTNGTRTEEIPILSGVKQGCPLSGILFNIAIDPTIRRLQGEATEHRVLAFADDVAIIAQSPAELQQQLNLISEDFERISLTLNPAKSVSFHLSGATPIGTRDTTFFINDQPLRILKEFENHKFLGKPVGYNPIPDFNDVNAIGKLGKSIAESLLAPWQKLDALKCFFYPTMQFAMRTGTFNKTVWAKLDTAMRKFIKIILNLPEIASNKYLYGSRKLGCMGMPIAAEESDLNLIDSAFKLLTSRDEITARNALEDLCSVCRFRNHRNATDEDLSKFMSGERIGDFEPQANRHSNIWTLSRAASKRLGVEWSFENKSPTIHFEDLSLQSNSRKRIMFTIRDRLRTAGTQALINEYSHQGKVLDCVSMSPASSHFFFTGTYTRFAKWRFVHPTRLGVVTLNGYKSWNPPEEQKCRRCNKCNRETLPHVICHCYYTSRAWIPRHNSVVTRIKKAVSPKAQILYENQRIPGYTCRPDLVISYNNTIYIIDATVTFENGRNAYDLAWDRKIEAYTHIIDFFKTPSNNVQIVPFVVGALGTWDPRNEAFLRVFCSRSYIKLMSKLCCSDVLRWSRVSEKNRWSRDIYIEHLSGVRQYDPTVLTNDAHRPHEIEPEDPGHLALARPSQTEERRTTTVNDTETTTEDNTGISEENTMY
ncbi:Retrovirus-related Pol polyprotein from type-2 retrotransposable element R2DM, partial [Araneus ventricosus]